MLALFKVLGSFGLMVVAAYLLVVAFLPPPTGGGWKPEDMSGTSAAARLTRQAQALATRRPVSSLQ